MYDQKMPPVLPGNFLLEEFIKPMGISPMQLAKETKIDSRKIRNIIKWKRAITADIALRLARFLGTSAELWLNLQAHYDLEIAKDRFGMLVFMEVSPYVDGDDNIEAW